MIPFIKQLFCEVNPIPVKAGLNILGLIENELRLPLTVILKEKVDPSIMGGMIVSSGGSMMDGSVKTKLENMHKQIRDMVSV